MGDRITAENIVNQLILDGDIAPEHKDEMIEYLDEMLRQASRRKVRNIVFRAVDYLWRSYASRSRSDRG